MTKDDVLALLEQADAPVSGEQMCKTLGLTRAAVWKAIEALREAGCDVMKAENMELLTVRGYTDELWRRYARGPQVFVRQATQSTVRVVRKRE